MGYPICRETTSVSTIAQVYWNTKGITASVNAGTIEKAINMGKNIVDYATQRSTYVGDLNVALQDELRKLNNKQKQMTGGNDGELTTTEKERFEKFVGDTEGEIQSSIMKTTLDTIQTAWLQPI
jgi:hypothetical protein